MTPRPQVSRAALELVKRFEGYRRRAVRLPDGRWMLGHGHTASAREGAEVSEADAEALLTYDLMGVARFVEELVYAPLNENQSAALVAFAFAIGLDAFRDSEVLKRVNAGDSVRAAYAIELWRRAEFEGESVLIDALIRRRAAEKLLFLTPPGGAWRPAPAAVLKAQLDHELADTTPASEPEGLAAWPQDEPLALIRPDEPEAERVSPVVAAAEAVTARLQALYPDVEPAIFKPSDGAVETEALAAEPEGDAVSAEADPPAADAVASPADSETPAAAEDAGARSDDDGEPMPRVVQEETPAYAFISAPVASASLEPDTGPLVIVALIILGAAFFAGGIFWAMNAQPGLQGGVFTPLLVGWLAGVAGVGFICAAVFMLLQRLGRDGEYD
jgi:lysozyme